MIPITWMMSTRILLWRLVLISLVTTAAGRVAREKVTDDSYIDELNKKIPNVFGFHQIDRFKSNVG